MIRLLYISTARQAHASSVLDPILRASRRNNAAAGVSGLLVAGGKRFLQVLEGPEAAVEKTYRRISTDHRHVAPVILSRRHVAERIFAEWAMGFQDAGSLSGAGRPNEALMALIAPISDPNLKADFEGFVHRHAA